ncbi:MAG: L-seryl-tRNA(Ser) seleniumtransferase [Thermoleophilaceae bacterium]|nr:L-seryl-tRNA(Ser) seleniumtransferase [Thermoleophilaceae bacterium]
MARAAGSKALSPELAERLRALPSVEELASSLDGVSHAVAVQAARSAVAAARERIRGGEAVDAAAVAAGAREWVAAHARPGLRRVINASGVIVHTNLGRAPLADAARDALLAAAQGYSNLELDLAAGERGSRQAHLEGLLCELTGAEAAMVVNNCAGAVLLAAAALAGGRELVVSRGQLVEIGGSFRVPDVVAQSGATLVEVGTTNRTRVADYADAIGERTGAVMRAHQSNFRTVGFVEEPSIEQICALGVPVIDDVGSGALAEGVPEMADEPAVKRSVAAGAAVVCFSGDKLLGGPQAGVMVGRADGIAACRTHPLARALRLDKLSLAALEATLRLYRDPREALREVPVLRMLVAGEAELQQRAEAMAAAISARCPPSGGLSDLPDGVRVVRASAKVGGGALPLLELEGPVCAVDPGAVGADELARRLRGGEPPVHGRTRDGWLLLDPRTLSDDEARVAAEAVVRALG